MDGDVEVHEPDKFSRLIVAIKQVIRCRIV